MHETRERGGGGRDEARKRPLLQRLTAMVDPFFPEPPLRIVTAYSLKKAWAWHSCTKMTTAMPYGMPTIGN